MNVADARTAGPGIPAGGGGGSLTSTPFAGSNRAWNRPWICQKTSGPSNASGTTYARRAAGYAS